MIGHISGILGHKWEYGCLVLTAGGIGYRINLPEHTYGNLPQSGAEISFYTFLAVREDAMELFGFETLEERETFELLRGISRVGSRTALSLLSKYRPEELRDLVIQENAAALAKVPGIGTKTSQHILLELRYRISSIAKAARSQAPAISAAHADTIGALINLGYAEDECIKIVSDIFSREPDLDAGSAIRLALKQLAKGNS